MSIRLAPVRHRPSGFALGLTLAAKQFLAPAAFRERSLDDPLHNVNFVRAVAEGAPVFTTIRGYPCEMFLRFMSSAYEGTMWDIREEGRYAYFTFPYTNERGRDYAVTVQFTADQLAGCRAVRDYLLGIVEDDGWIKISVSRSLPICRTTKDISAKSLIEPAKPKSEPKPKPVSIPPPRAPSVKPPKAPSVRVPLSRISRQSSRLRRLEDRPVPDLAEKARLEEKVSAMARELEAARRDLGTMHEQVQKVNAEAAYLRGFNDARPVVQPTPPPPPPPPRSRRRSTRRRSSNSALLRRLDELARKLSRPPPPPPPAPPANVAPVQTVVTPPGADVCDCGPCDCCSEPPSPVFAPYPVPVPQMAYSPMLQPATPNFLPQVIPAFQGFQGFSAPVGCPLPVSAASPFYMPPVPMPMAAHMAPLEECSHTHMHW